MSRAIVQFAESVRLYRLRRPFAKALLLTCIAALAGAAGQVRADDDVLKLVPDMALGFAIVNRPEAADAKLQALGQQMKLPIPSALAKLGGPGGIGPGGIQEGLDKKRPIAVLVLPPKEGMPIPTVILLVPVTDYAKFVGQFKPGETEAGVSKIALFGSPALTRSIGSYAALTSEEVPRCAERPQAGRRGFRGLGPVAEVAGEERRGRRRLGAGNPHGLGEAAARHRHHQGGRGPNGRPGEAGARRSGNVRDASQVRRQGSRLVRH